MMAEGDGLRPLQMGIAGENVGLVRLGLRRERGDERLRETDDLGCLASEIHAQIERDLIVPAARGVQLFPHVADALGEHLLDKHVDVLGAHVKLQRAGIQIVQNALQRVDDALRVRLRDDLLCAEHGRVRHGARDVLLIHAAVKADGGIEVVRDLIGVSGGSAGP